MIISLEQVVRTLNEHGVRFIIIGGWAAIFHGAARSTNDVDVVYSRDAGRPKDLEAIAELQAILEERRKQEPSADQ